MHGGKRPGAGRPEGAASKRTRAIADASVQDGVTPLEVMLATMRQHFAAGRFDEAAEVASRAAPYVHPRLAAIQHAGPGGGDIVVNIVRFGRSDGAFDDMTAGLR